MKTKVWTALLALYIVWGSTYLAIRFAVETLPPFMMAGMRFLVSGLILLVWRRAAGDALPTRNQWKSVAVVGILLLLGGNGLLSFSEQRIASGVAALIVGTVPLWLVLIEALRPKGVKPDLRTLVGLGIGFVGIYLLIGPTGLRGGLQFDLVGILAVIAAAFLWSLGSIYSRSADVPSSTLMMTAGEMLTGSMALFIVSGLSGEWSSFNLAGVTLRSWMGLGYLVVFGSLVGFVSYGWLLHNASVSLVATYAYVNPVVAVLLGALLAQETLNARILAASAVIIGSVVFINSAHRTKEVEGAIEREAIAAG
jgi:drug/metabolite transporter (DMT)-like permease